MFSLYHWGHWGIIDQNFWMNEKSWRRVRISILWINHEVTGSRNKELTHLSTINIGWKTQSGDDNNFLTLPGMLMVLIPWNRRGERRGGWRGIDSRTRRAEFPHRLPSRPCWSLHLNIKYFHISALQTNRPGITMALLHTVILLRKHYPSSHTKG